MIARLACLALVVGSACGNDFADPMPPPSRAILPVRVRLLTDAQYTNAVHDLLGGVTVPPLRSPGTRPHQLVHEDVLAVDAPLLVQYRIAAEAVAAQIARDANVLLGCPDGDDGCARDRVVDLGSRALRHPLDAVEADQLWKLYQLGRAEGPPAGFALVVEALLQSPSFVYRTELGAAPGEVVELTPYELAANLSFLLLDSIPDPPLRKAAADGSLATPGGLAAEVDRLLELPRVRDHLVDVVLDWLDVPGVLTASKDAEVFPELTPELRDSMYGETRRFVTDVLWSRGGSLRELLTSNHTFVDARLAKIYGVHAASSGHIPMTLGSRRGGILTQASVLTNLATEQRESIIRRGMFVHHKFLCTPDPGRPPFAAISNEGGLTVNMTEAQFSYYRTSHRYCSGCHTSIDPPGRALQHFDGLGRWRDADEHGAPIESDAEVAIGGERVALTDAVGLGRALAGSHHVARCVVDQLAHHALGRTVTDRETADYLHQRFESADRDLVEVFRAIATSPAFRLRRGPP